MRRALLFSTSVPAGLGVPSREPRLANAQRARTPQLVTPDGCQIGNARAALPAPNASS
jgi:hypothetical protein